MTIIDMYEYEETSYRRQLKALYHELDETTLPYELGIERRKYFFRTMRGRFINVCRLKRNMPIIQALDFLNISDVSLIENGLYDLSDRQFYLLVTFLGCAKEIPVFIEKMEKAMTPGLREERKRLEPALKKYGIRFADSDEKSSN